MIKNSEQASPLKIGWAGIANLYSAPWFSLVSVSQAAAKK
jgi:hypothetical protein